MGPRLAVATFVLAVVACDSKSDNQQLAPSTQELKPKVGAFAGELPKVDDGGAVVPLDKRKPGNVVIVNADGTMTMMAATGDAWPSQIAGKDPITLDGLRARMLAESDSAMPPDTQDDPPPPEEDPEDEGVDESGGTGTAMALEEGKMGKKDSDRAEGQYKMRKGPDPQLARQQTIEAAREAGILGSTTLQQGGAFASLTGTADFGAPFGSLASAGGVPVDVTPGASPMVFADPKAKAVALVEVLSINGGAIAVRRAGNVGFFRVGFASAGELSGGFGAPFEEVWVEAHLETTKLHLLVGGLDKRYEIPLVNDKIDFAQLASRLDEIKKLPQFEKVDIKVDVLAHGDMTVQKLVDVLVAVDAARVKTRIGVSPTTAEERQTQGTGWGTIGTGRYGTIGGDDGGYGVGGGRGGMRGRTADVPTVRIGQPDAAGDLDKAIIRRYIKRNIQKVQYCYEKILLEKPDIQGTVNTQFSISPNGVVTSSNASGVDGEVSSCVANVIKNIQFPKPKNGGMVQVNYPFTFRKGGDE